jgi:poly(A) polymerase
LRNTDIRISEGKSVTPAFLFAALLWPVLTQRLRSESYEKKFDFQIYQRCANAVLMEQLDYTAVPKRFTIAAREIWELQLRLERRAKHFLGNALNNPRFRAGYDFLLLREESGEDLKGVGQWWTDFQIGDTKQRTELIARVASPINRRKRRKKNKPSGVTN